MKRSLQISFLFLAVVAAAARASAQGTAFSYQGRLNDNGGPANGTYDLRFMAYNSAIAPTPAGGQISIPGVVVSNGLFTVTVDFGVGLFTGPQRWLEISVRTNGGANFVTLEPRQVVTSVPYATHAATASNVVSGSVVKSLNNLRDDVSLLAGANVTLTPIGNSITIAATNGGGGSGPWALNGASAYYNGGRVGVGTTTPVSRLTVSGAGVFDSPLAAAITLDNTAAGRRWEWHALDDGRVQLADFTAGITRMMFDLNGSVGIGALSPQAKLHLLEPAGSVTHLIETGGGINAWARASFKNLNGQWDIGTSRSFNGDQFYVSRLGSPGIAFGIQPNGDAFLARNVSVGGNVGIGTATPADKLYIAGEGASGYAIGIEGNARQNRDKGGWVKAMAKVNADGSISQQFSAFGGTINASFNGTIYTVTFPFRVDDRFISLTPFHNFGTGNIPVPVIYDYTAANAVRVSIRNAADSESGVIANEFFVFVY